METAADILGQSQTFLGVLLTLNVLCLFGEKTGNFIFHTILNQKDRMKRKIELLMKHLSQETSDVEKTEAWRNVKQIADPHSKFDEEDKLKSRNLMMVYNLEVSGFVIDITSFERNSKSIENANEQFIGPLLSLYYGLIIFVLNEIVAYGGGAERWFVNLVYVFTIVSFVYCLSLWGSFANRDFSIAGKFNKFLQKTWNWADSVLGKWWGGLLKIVISSGIFALIACLIDFSSTPDWLTLIISTIGFVIIIAVVGLSRLMVCEVKGNYSYFHALGHMTAFIIYAVIISCIINLSHVSDVYSYLPTLPAIRLLIMAFVIINGILFPFLLPYLRINKEAKKMREEMTSAFDGRQQAAEKFKKGYEDFCKCHGEKSINQITENAAVKTPETISVQIPSLSEYVGIYQELTKPESISEFCKRHNLNEQDFRTIRKQMLNNNKR